MVISLRPNFDLLAQLKALHIVFLDENGMDFLVHDQADTILLTIRADQKRCFGLLCNGVGFQG